MLQEFSSEASLDPQILRVAGLVNPIGDKKIDEQWPGIDPTEMEVELADGRIIKVRVEEAKGDLVNPVTDEEVISKFREITSEFFTPGRTEAVITSCDALESMKNISGLMKLLEPDR